MILSLAAATLMNAAAVQAPVSNDQLPNLVVAACLDGAVARRSERSEEDAEKPAPKIRKAKAKSAAPKRTKKEGIKARREKSRKPKRVSKSGKSKRGKSWTP